MRALVSGPSTNRRMDAPRVDILIYESPRQPDYAADQLDCRRGQPARINTLIVLALHVTGLLDLGGTHCPGLARWRAPTR